jgi:hypothetical protein
LDHAGRRAESINALGRKQEDAIAALLTQRNVEEAARAAGIGARTLLRWLKLPEFQSAYREARREASSQAVARLQHGTSAAATTLLKIMIDSNAPASVRVQAADSVVQSRSQGDRVGRHRGARGGAGNSRFQSRHEMRAILSRIRRLENTTPPADRERAIVEAIRAARGRRPGADYVEPMPFPRGSFAGCRTIADRIRRARQLRMERDGLSGRESNEKDQQATS